MAEPHGPNVVDNTEQVVHGATKLGLWAGSAVVAHNMLRPLMCVEVQALQRERHVLVELDRVQDVAVLEPFEVKDEHLRQLPDLQRLGGLHMLLTLVAVPLVVPAQHFRRGELLQALVKCHTRVAELVRVFGCTAPGKQTHVVDRTVSTP